MFLICCPHHHSTLPADPTGKYLSLLEAAFVKLDAGTLRELSVSAGGLVKTLAMVWTSSKAYNTAKRMVSHTHMLPLLWLKAVRKMGGYQRSCIAVVPQARGGGFRGEG